MRRRFLIRNFFSLTLPVLLVVVLLGVMALFITADGTKNSIESIDRQTVERIADSTRLIFSEADAQSLNYSVSPYMILKLEGLLQNGYSDKSYLDVAYMIKTTLDSNVNSKPFLHSVCIYLNNDGGNFFASGVGLANRLNYLDVSWIESARRAPREAEQWLELRRVSEYAGSSYSTNVITLYKRLYRSGHTGSVGVIVINIRQDYLQKFLTAYLTYPGQGIYLLGSDGRVLCAAGAAAGSDRLDPDALGRDHFVSQEENTAYGLRYVAVTPRSELYVQSESMVHTVLLFTVGSLLLGMALAYLVTRKNSRNVENIILLLESAEKGEAPPEIRVGADEYGFIIQNIVKTFLEKSYLKMQLSEKKYKLETMYFSFLQSQLNPHFLFNTLKNIFWKTVRLTGEPNDASKMIDRLTSLLHYTLVDTDRFVSVEEEIEKTNCYLEIQQMRFDYQFAVEWDCGEDVPACKCIKFMLQPLVENSVSHGLAQLDGKGALRISIHNGDGFLRVAVEDNGNGFTPGRLAEVNSALKDEDAPVKGIGLYNLNKRLVLTYGEQARLSIESEPFVRTVIRFCFPAQD